MSTGSGPVPRKFLERQARELAAAALPETGAAEPLYFEGSLDDAWTYEVIVVLKRKPEPRSRPRRP